MMSELTRLRDEALRLLTLYEEHHDSAIDWKRRKVHVDLDRFLMENRHTAILLMLEGLQQEMDNINIELNFAEAPPWYKRVFKQRGLIYGTKRRNESLDN